jgi:hypothetical protein
MTIKISEAFRLCATRAVSIDLPTRTWFAGYRGYAPIYVGASFIGYFVTCVVTSQISYCDNNALVCDVVEGGVINAARAYSIGGYMYLRGGAGMIDRALSYDRTDGAKLCVKITIPFFVALIEGMEEAGHLKKHKLVDATLLGGVVAVSEWILDIFAQSISGPASGDANVIMNDANVTVSGEVADGKVEL